MVGVLAQRVVATRPKSQSSLTRGARLRYSAGFTPNYFDLQQASSRLGGYSPPQVFSQWSGVRWYDFVRNSEVSLRTGLAPVSDRITRGRNAIFGHVVRLPDNFSAHQAMLRQVELSVGRPQTLHGNVHQVDHVTNGPTNSAAITTVFPLRLCGGKPLVAVTRERRCGPSRLRVNDEVHGFESVFPSVAYPSV